MVYLEEYKENLSIKIKELDDQIKSKADEIRAIELSITEKANLLHTQLEEVRENHISSNSELDANLKEELLKVKEKLSIIEQNKSKKLNETGKIRNMNRRQIVHNFKCKECEKIFSTRTEMEVHIETSHVPTMLKCDNCDFAFVSEWRLKKHRKIHEEHTYSRKCHYYISGKPCPFENLGCKFLHIFSKVCKYGRECTHKMCQFRH